MSPWGKEVILELGPDLQSSLGALCGVVFCLTSCPVWQAESNPSGQWETKENAGRLFCCQSCSVNLEEQNWGSSSTGEKRANGGRRRNWPYSYHFRVGMVSISPNSGWSIAWSLGIVRNKGRESVVPQLALPCKTGNQHRTGFNPTQSEGGLMPDNSKHPPWSHGVSTCFWSYLALNDWQGLVTGTASSKGKKNGMVLQLLLICKVEKGYNWGVSSKWKDRKPTGPCPNFLKSTLPKGLVSILPHI